MDTSEPEEEFGLLEESFAAWTYPLRFSIPNYAGWLARRDASFAYQVHRQAMRPRDKAALGAEQLEFMSRMLTGAATARPADPDLDRRFIDVSYPDLVADPIRVAGEIYRRFGWTFDDQTRARMEGWHAGQAARRQAERRHRYALSDYGLTEDQADDAFSGYTEFTLARLAIIR